MYWTTRKATVPPGMRIVMHTRCGTFIMNQDQDTQLNPDHAGTELSRKAWTAYISIVARCVVLGGLCVATLVWHSDLWKIVVPVMLFGGALIAYRIAWLRSCKLYFDDNGVWIYSGLLPWKRGVSGVKWRDLDEAVFVNGFWSWLSRSYTIQLRHRFAKVTEIYADHMARGKDAVMAINQEHRKHISRLDNADARS